MTMAPWRRRRPFERTLRKSLELRRDSKSGSETLPTLLTARTESCAASTGLHSVTEAMTTLTATYFWLVGPLHDKQSVEGGESYRLRIGIFLCQSRARRFGSRFTEKSRRNRQDREKMPKPDRSILSPVSRILRIRKPFLPGISLWKGTGKLIHTADSRDLDSFFWSSDTRPSRTWERANFPLSLLDDDAAPRSK